MPLEKYLSKLRHFSRGIFCTRREEGIRTLETLPFTHFPGVRLRPLGHLSVGGRLAKNHRGMQGAFAGLFQFLRTAHNAPAARHSNIAAIRIVGAAIPWKKANTPVKAIPTKITTTPSEIASRNALRGAVAATQRITAGPANMGAARRVMNCTPSSATTP